jgi:RNA polymerase sigma-70 factor, ECF subfamily
MTLARPFLRDKLSGVSDVGGPCPTARLGARMDETRSSLLIRVRDPSDHDSWREFVTLYEPLLLAFARRQDLSESDARDVTQDVLVKLYTALTEFELDHSRGRFRTWLWRLTSNAIVDLRRRHTRQLKAEQQRATAAIEARIGEDVWVGLHRQRVMEFALERVRERSQPKPWACFEEHTLRGRPAAGVAAELGVSANSVYVHCSNILRRVRELCREYQEELADGSVDLPT